MVNLQIAKDAWAEATRLHASPKVMLALFETGLVESGFKNYANSNIPESMRIPHDAVGHDHKSVGYLQQQVPWWGTVQQCMNTAYATRQFVNRARSKESRYSTSGRLAQAVQVSAFPDRYDQMQSRATALINQVKGSVAPAKPYVYPTGTPAFSGTLKLGSTGDAVRTLHRRLNILGYKPSLPEAGAVFNNNTVHNVKAFQSYAKITQDGVVGSITWGKLWSPALRKMGVSEEELDSMTPLAELITPEEVYAQKEASFEPEPDIPVE